MRRVAIGCQGGGSHTAFTAGALMAVIRDWLEHRSFEIAALSGASGGAVCALLAWYGLLVDGGRTALRGLERFWTEGYPRGNAAVLPWDWATNTALVSLLRLEVTAEVSPYALDLPLGLLPLALQRQLRPWIDAKAALRNLLQE